MNSTYKLILLFLKLLKTMVLKKWINLNFMTHQIRGAHLTHIVPSHPPFFLLSIAFWASRVVHSPLHVLIQVKFQNPSILITFHPSLPFIYIRDLIFHPFLHEIILLNSNDSSDKQFNRETYAGPSGYRVVLPINLFLAQSPPLQIPSGFSFI